MFLASGTISLKISEMMGDKIPPYQKRLNICIVSHNAYGAITGGEKGHAGGVERQTSLIARWLASRGHRVSLLTWNEGGPGEEIIDNVRIIKMCRQDEGIPGFRFFYPRWTSLIWAMKRADAHLYYQNCAEYVTGQVALWCRHHRRRFVYSVASTPDCDPNLPTMRKIRERVLYRYGLRHADQIIVQTKIQQRMLLEGFGLPSIVLPMPCPGPSEKEYKPPLPPDRGRCRVLWVGRICRQKNLELLLEVAKAISKVGFDVVGKTDLDDAYLRKVLTLASSLPNVKVHGMVPRDRMVEMYRNASILCCTSLFEGFPNTFLEAWSHGLPIVSTVDPDNLIATRNLGIFSKDKDELISGIKTVLESPSLWQVMSDNARRYYTENHTLDQAMKRFEKIFLETIQIDK